MSPKPAQSISLLIHGSTGQLRCKSEGGVWRAAPAVPWTQKDELADSLEPKDSRPAWKLEQDLLTLEEDKEKEGKDKKAGAREERVDKEEEKGESTGREILCEFLASYSSFSQNQGEA